MKKIIKKFKEQRGDYVQMIYLFPIYLLVFSFLAIKLDLITTRNTLDDDLRVSLRAGSRAENSEELVNAIKRGLHKEGWAKKDGNVVYTFRILEVDLITEKTIETGIEGDHKTASEQISIELWKRVNEPSVNRYYILEIYSIRKAKVNTGWTKITIRGQEMQWFDQSVGSTGRMIMEGKRSE